MLVVIHNNTLALLDMLIITLSQTRLKLHYKFKLLPHELIENPMLLFNILKKF